MLKDIKLEALDLDVDTSKRCSCPFCGRQDKGFLISRYAQGIYYKCFHASCGESGFISSHNYTRSNKKKKSHLRDFTHDLVELPQHVLRLLLDKYSISEARASAQGFKYVACHHRLYMPIYDLRGYEVGAVTKKLPPVKEDGFPKALTYWFNDVPKLHAPLNSVLRNDTVVVVEDILSANTIEELVDVQAVALLGTNMDDKIASTIGQHYQNVIIALDPDAYSQAIRMRNNFGLYWNHSEVANTYCDPKDATKEQLYDMLQRHDLLPVQGL